jgi:acyl-CoA thioesterase-1
VTAAQATGEAGADSSARGARGLRALAALALCVSVAACGQRDARPQASQTAASKPPVVVFFGDSITSGQGVPEERAFPALLQRKLDAEGIPAQCVNAGVPGDTTESALERLEGVAHARPRVVVVELGANDAFRGMSRIRTHTNLQRIVERFREAGARVILAGAVFPQAQHPAYMLSMGRAFAAIAEKGGAVLIPDLMDGVAGEASLNLDDGIHPNAQGHARLAENAWPTVRDVVAALD